MTKTLVIILGPHAVGKMTVGQELAKITDLRLFHNHMSIELARKLFAPSGKSPESRRRVHPFGAHSPPASRAEALCV